MVKKITKLESIGIIDKLVCRTSIPWTKPKYLAIGKELLDIYGENYINTIIGRVELIE